MEGPTEDQQALDAALRKVWRKRFQHDVPVKDHAELLTSILIECGVPQETIDRAVVDERAKRGLN